MAGKCYIKVESTWDHHLSIWSIPPLNTSITQSIHHSIHPSLNPSITQSIHYSIHPFIYPTSEPVVYLSIHTTAFVLPVVEHWLEWEELIQWPTTPQTDAIPLSYVTLPSNGWYHKCLEDSSLISRKEMFYLTMHSAHFIYGYMVSDTYFKPAI